MTVPVEGAPAGVEPVSVDLEHDSLLAPEEVDDVALESDLSLGLRQTCLPYERQEEPLSLRLGDGRVCAAPQQRAKGARAAVTGAASQDVIELPRADGPQYGECLVNLPLERVSGERRSTIEQRPSRGGHR